MWARWAWAADPSLLRGPVMAVFAAADPAGVFGEDPLSGYDVGVDDSGLFNVNAKLMGFFLNMVFSVIKFVAKTVAVIVEWAVTLDAPAMFGEQAEKLASRFHHMIGFDDPAGATLFRMALVAAVTVVTVRLARGRTSKGLAEAGVSWAILMLYLGWVASAPAGFAAVVSGGVGASQEIGGQVAAGLMGAAPGLLPAECRSDEGAVSEVGCAIRSGVYAVYVQAPYDILNWGRDLGSADDARNPLRRCAAARDRLVAGGPWGNDPEPRERMIEAGCDAEAEYQAGPSADRLADAMGILTLEMAAVWVPLLLALVTIFAGLRLMLRAVSAPVVVAMGLIPGQTRIGLWQWVAKTLVVMVSLANAIVSLAIYLILVSSTFGSALSFFAAGVVNLIIGLVVLLAWWRTGRAGKEHATRWAEKLASSEGGDAEGGRVRPAPSGVTRAEYRANTLIRRARQLGKVGRRRG